MSTISGFVNSENRTQRKSASGTDDRRLKPSEATDLITYHEKSSTNGHGDRVPIVLKNSDGEAIDGFFFHKKDILAALGISESEQNKSDTSGIYVAIGQHNKEDKETPEGHTLVLFGVSTNLDTNTQSTVDEFGRIFDYSKPCPCNCPRTGQTC